MPRFRFVVIAGSGETIDGCIDAEDEAAARSVLEGRGLAVRSLSPEADARPVIADAWYYVPESGQQRGPVSLGELRALLRGGSVLSTDLVWTEGMADWVS